MELYARVRRAVSVEGLSGGRRRGTAEQWIKEGKNAINWTRLSFRTFAANAVRLQLHTLAYNLGNFLRTLATPEPIENWSLTSLKEKLIKIGGKVVNHGRYIAFQMAEVAVPRKLFAEILQPIPHVPGRGRPAGRAGGSARRGLAGRGGASDEPSRPRRLSPQRHGERRGSQSWPTYNQLFRELPRSRLILPRSGATVRAPGSAADDPSHSN